MLFFAELIGKNVFSEDQRLLGRLFDIKFLNAEIPLVTKIVVTKESRRTEVPIISLKHVNNHIVVKRIANPTIIPLPLTHARTQFLCQFSEIALSPTELVLQTQSSWVSVF